MTEMVGGKRLGTRILLLLGGVRVLDRQWYLALGVESHIVGSTHDGRADG